MTPCVGSGTLGREAAGGSARLVWGRGGQRPCVSSLVIDVTRNPARAEAQKEAFSQNSLIPEEPANGGIPGWHHVQGKVERRGGGGGGGAVKGGSTQALIPLTSWMTLDKPVNLSGVQDPHPGDELRGMYLLEVCGWS